MPGKLTTHVLDTAQGRPAEDLTIDLFRVDPSGERHHLKTLTTNADGRTDEPMLEGMALQPGIYELMFEVGTYFQRYLPTTNPPFLDRVPVQFGIADETAHYHVPLLVSPWSYSTYRGS